MKILNELIERAKKTNSTIIFAEGDEERTLEAAVRLVKDNVCKAVVVATDLKNIEETAKRKNLDISKLSVIIPKRELLDEKILSKIVEYREGKGFFKEDTVNLMLDPLYFSSLYVKSGKADGCVAGARSDTADVLRAALLTIGTAENIKIISSFFLMVPPEGHTVIKNPVLFADCAVNPVPSSNSLTDIAVSTVRNFKILFPEKTAKVVFLSFSTKGSAQHQSTKKVKDAVVMTNEYFKSDDKVVIDGEFQFDAAVVENIAVRKAPDSPIKGDANIFIFPDLNSGNICYKAVERLGGFKAIGPIIQGLSKPASDLSRGCSVEDIYYVAAINILQSNR
ncbi:MAG: phosphate acetyltransferase [Elusimicrobia bacterium]|nr:phosphate acetyltransferase [Elusimicrobiota bacterium]